ncbi:TetR/AcrR family transcriptional regulator [Citricoccus sp. I39-566]|uniref:TetR/AcrR family transcriptional regulator n=1 Tax=Citricoccus sp. I39-566 TaxID=3073268 RepID=UPI00286B5DBE|nr:TetR/AcrR family transcriptional regulator [Citricoccus sp. I39-566]WMY76854.1 TetR/AcrR family transcriptional regulator [Citricoccus sp. I39-566]
MTTEQTARAAAKADRRQSLLQAAARLFAELGFTSVRLEDLGAACGISGPGVYRHFPGKNAVLGELLLQVSRDLLTGAQQVVARQGPARGILAALVRFQADFAVAHRDVIAVQDREMRHLDAEARAEVVRLQRAYIGLWADQLVLVHPDEDHATAVFRAQAAFGLLNSTPHSVRRSPAEQSGRGALLERMALAALLAGPVGG